MDDRIEVADAYSGSKKHIIALTQDKRCIAVGLRMNGKGEFWIHISIKEWSRIKEFIDQHKYIEERI